jgi:hypothetical protein
MPMTTVHATNPDNLLATLQSDSAARLKTELEELRAGLVAWSEQALDRFRSAGLVPVDAAAGVIQELAAVVSAERQRASHLEEALRSTQGELELAKQSARDLRDETIAQLQQQLLAAREAETALQDAATKARAELKAVRDRSQEIIDEQALQLMEFKRELDEIALEVRRARAGMVSIQRDTPDPDHAPAAPVVAGIERRRRRDVVQFDAIDAALADSPPVPQWPRVAV